MANTPYLGHSSTCRVGLVRVDKGSWSIDQGTTSGGATVCILEMRIIIRGLSVFSGAIDSSALY
jgi:hypothetical protein